MIIIKLVINKVEINYTYISKFYWIKIYVCMYNLIALFPKHIKWIKKISKKLDNKNENAEPTRR